MNFINLKYYSLINKYIIEFTLTVVTFMNKTESAYYT